jgi:hypothetical protein
MCRRRMRRTSRRTAETEAGWRCNATRCDAMVVVMVMLEWAYVIGKHDMVATAQHRQYENNNLRGRAVYSIKSSVS